MCTKNYFVELVNRELEKGEDLTTCAIALADMAEKARQCGAWPIWNLICEAQMVLGIQCASV